MAQGTTPHAKEVAAVEDIHAAASGSLGRIRGMAHCALMALESPRCIASLEHLAEVLQAIALDADLAHNDVDVCAERWGIKVLDEAWVRRLDARRAHRKSDGLSHE